MSDDVAKDLAAGLKVEPILVSFRRFASIQPFSRNETAEYLACKPVVGSSVADFSHYRPTANLVRAALSAGNLSTKGIYDFDDGKDNGYTPKLRKIAPDAVEIDLALQTVKDSAKKAKDDADKAQLEKEQNALAEKAVKGLSALSDVVDSVKDGSTEA